MLRSSPAKFFNSKQTPATSTKCSHSKVRGMRLFGDNLKRELDALRSALGDARDLDQLQDEIV